MSIGSAPEPTRSRCDSTTWKMSPARMYSLHASTARSNASRRTLDSNGIRTGSRPTTSSTRSGPGRRSRSHTASIRPHASAYAAGASACSPSTAFATTRTVLSTWSKISMSS